MKITRVLARSAAVITAVAGVGLAAAGPAGASVSPGPGTGTWRAFGNTNPTSVVAGRWSCAKTVQIGVNVGAQVCTIHQTTGDFESQAAVIVRNNKPVTYDAIASMSLFMIIPDGGFQGSWDCPKSGVAPDTWSVCFGQLLSLGLAEIDATGEAGNGVSLGTSPPN